MEIRSGHIGTAFTARYWQLFTSYFCPLSKGFLRRLFHYVIPSKKKYPPLREVLFLVCLDLQGFTVFLSILCNLNSRAGTPLVSAHGTHENHFAACFEELAINIFLKSHIL